MKLSDAEWIFFDMGYTLINEDEAHYARLADLGPLSPEMKEVFWRMVDQCAQAGKRAPIPSAIRRMGVPVIPHYNSFYEKAFEYSEPVLRELHRDRHIGIIANQGGGSVKRLKKFGLLDHIDFVYSSDEIGKFKPDPEFFRSAVRAVGVPAGRCIMVGDRPDNDVGPAKAAGMMTVRVRLGGFRAKEVCEPELLADAEIPDIRMLPELLVK